MTRLHVPILLGLFLLLAATPSEGGPFGLGIIVGEPTGISAKLRLGGTNAVDGAVAWSLDGSDDLHLHADYLWHNYNVIPVQKGRLPLYFGIGGRLQFREDRDDTIGVRFPVGLEYIFATAPFNVFAEVAGILDLNPDTDFDVNGGFGVRFIF